MSRDNALLKIHVREKETRTCKRKERKKEERKKEGHEREKAARMDVTISQDKTRRIDHHHISMRGSLWR